MIGISWATHHLPIVCQLPIYPPVKRKAMAMEDTLFIADIRIEATMKLVDFPACQV